MERKWLGERERESKGGGGRRRGDRHSRGGRGREPGEGKNRGRDGEMKDEGWLSHKLPKAL